MKINSKKTLAAATALCLLTSSPVFAAQGDYLRLGPSGEKSYAMPANKAILIDDVRKKVEDDTFYKELADGKYINPVVERENQMKKLAAILAKQGLMGPGKQEEAKKYLKENIAVVQEALLKATEETPKIERPSASLKVASVSAITKEVAAGKADQKLGFVVNGDNTITLKQITDAGYTVKFAATKAVLDDGAGAAVSENATGLLRKDSLTDGTTFKYTITISKAGQEDITSGVPVSVTVKTVDDAKITAITKVALVITGDGNVNDDDKLWKNNFITVDYNKGNDSVAVVPTKGTNALGKVIEPAAGKTNLAGLVDSSVVVTYESSEPFVALVNSTTGVVTPLSEGTTTITVKGNGKVVATVPVVVKEAQTPTALKEKTKTIPKQSGTQDIELVVVDEDGKDLLKDYGDYTAEVVGTNKADITVKKEVTDDKAKLTVTVPKADKAGTYTVNIKLGDKVLDTLTLTVAALPSEADKYEILKKSDSSIITEIIKLDLKVGGAKELELKYQGYHSASNLPMGEAKDITAGGEFALESSDTEVVAIESHNKIVAKGVGTAQVKLVQLGYVWDTVTVEVANTTPKITKIALKEGKDKIQVKGGVSTDKSVIADIFDDLEVTFDNKAVKLNKNGDDLTLEEIALIMESNGNIKDFDEIGSADVATASTGKVPVDTEGVLIIKVSDLYGGGSYSFPVVVLDGAGPRISSWSMDMSKNGDEKEIVLTFDEPVAADKLDLSKVKVDKASTGSAQVLTGAEKEQVDPKTIRVKKLGAAIVKGIDTVSSIQNSEADSYILVLDANACEDAKGNKSETVANVGAPATFVKDNVAAKIIKAVAVDGMAENTAITLTFDDYMVEAADKAASYTVTTAGSGDLNDGEAAADDSTGSLKVKTAAWANSDKLATKEAVKDIAGNTVDEAADTVTFTNAANASDHSKNTID